MDGQGTYSVSVLAEILGPVKETGDHCLGCFMKLIAETLGSADMSGFQ